MYILNGPLGRLYQSYIRVPQLCQLLRDLIRVNWVKTFKLRDHQLEFKSPFQNSFRLDLPLNHQNRDMMDSHEESRLFPFRQGKFCLMKRRKGMLKWQKPYLVQKSRVLQKLRKPQNCLVMLISPLLGKPVYLCRRLREFEKRFTQ